jgi:UDP-N-acetylmuramate--alanine ligase
LEGPIEKEAAYGQRFVVSVSGQARQPDHLHDYNGLEVRLRVPGAHNVQNALSVVAAAAEEGLAPGAVAAGLSEFEGAARRFHVVGTAEGVTVVDDYAHHPTEIAATLAAARTVANGRVIAVFQPHLYSRTQQLAEDFAHSLVEADICVVLPIYGAREEPLEGVTSELIAEPLRRAKNNGVELVRTRNEAVEVVRENAQCGDLVLLMGAGDVNQLAPVLLQRC